MKKTSILLGVSALVMGVVLAMPQSTLAYKGNPAVKGPNYSSERHEAMEKAFEKKDYNAWKKLMTGRGRVTQVVNAQNFAQFAKAHELAEQGKVAEVNKIRAELGLGQGSGYGNKNR